MFPPSCLTPSLKAFPALVKFGCGCCSRDAAVTEGATYVSYLWNLSIPSNPHEIYAWYHDSHHWYPVFPPREPPPPPKWNLCLWQVLAYCHTGWLKTDIDVLIYVRDFSRLYGDCISFPLNCWLMDVVVAETRYTARSASSCLRTQARAVTHEAGFYCHCVSAALHRLIGWALRVRASYWLELSPVQHCRTSC